MWLGFVAAVLEGRGCLGQLRGHMTRYFMLIRQVIFAVEDPQPIPEPGWDLEFSYSAITAITTNRKLEGLLTQYSDVTYYSFLIANLKSRISTLKKDLRIYLMYESDIQEMEQENVNLEKELAEARIERETLPEINLEEIQSYSEIESRYHTLSKEVMTLRNKAEAAVDIIKLDKARIRDTTNQIENMEEEIKNFMIEHPSVDQEIARITESPFQTEKWIYLRQKPWPVS